MSRVPFSDGKPGPGFEKQVSGFDSKKIGYSGRVSGFQKMYKIGDFWLKKLLEKLRKPGQPNDFKF